MGKEGDYSIPGFRAASGRVGIKEKGGDDVALFLSDFPSVSSVVFTKNLVKAAPVHWARKAGRLDKLRGIFVNSGNANACTGNDGIARTEMVSRSLASCLKVPEGTVLISSTGIIGVPLPHKKIISGIGPLCEKLSSRRFSHAAKAMMTTDAFEKISSRKFSAGGRVLTILGVAKGAGMIAPDMGTMLAYIFTDCSLKQERLERVFRQCVEQTFNRIIVDGDMSTNDTVALLSNGATLPGPLKGRDVESFRDALTGVMGDLALKIVSDGEGASRVVRIEVKGTRSQSQAEALARSIGTSLLVKTAICGGDLNWGRVVAAAGRAGVPFDPENFELFVGGTRIISRGLKIREGGLKKAKEHVQGKYFEITLLVGKGRGSYYVYTSDLTKAYVELNSKYTT